jgi:mono/diheme cytochrome c family protein
LNGPAAAQQPKAPLSAAATQVGTEAIVADGRKVYDQQKCASCHQIARRGNSRFPLDGVGSRLTPEQLRRWMTDTAAMEAALPRLPAIRMSEMKFRLNPRELDALVAYLASLK